MKTSELTGAVLDWAVATAEKKEFFLEKGAIYVYEQGANLPHVPYYDRIIFKPSVRWDQGGPIIEREGLQLGINLTGWVSSKYNVAGYGPTPLVAAMRCLVASKLGDEVEVPDELL